MIAKEETQSNLVPARVCRINKRYYTLLDENSKQYLARIKGKIRYKSDVQSQLPVVGDIVLMKTDNNENALIDSILERKNVLYRKSSKKKKDIQVLVSNVDYAFIILSIESNIEISAIARYLSIVHSQDIIPIIVINKTDLYEEVETLDTIAEIKNAFSNEIVFAHSVVTSQNYEKFLEYISDGKSAVFIGPSGSGKSTIINSLLKKEHMKTNEVREYDYKGMHTTTHRELMVLENKGIVIDTPGIRAIGIWENNNGLEKVFSKLEKYSKKCKFNDCTHTHEPDCYILHLADTGKISLKLYNAYISLNKEKTDLSKENMHTIRKNNKIAIAKVIKSMKNGKSGKTLKRNK